MNHCKVNLISHTSHENIVDVMYTACRNCYSELDAGELHSNRTSIDTDTKISLIDKVLRSGHTSIAEHVFFTFTIDGISRACSHQLVRHRHASYSQKSQRYVKENEMFDYNVPTEIAKDSELRDTFQNHMEDVFKLYEELLSKGVKAEDARAILPNAATTSIVMTLNLRELIHLANIRLCVRAQEEIRKVVKCMCELVSHKYDFLNKLLQPICIATGKCKEHKSCKK